MLTTDDKDPRVTLSFYEIPLPHENYPDSYLRSTSLRLWQKG